MPQRESQPVSRWREGDSMRKSLTIAAKDRMLIGAVVLSVLMWIAIPGSAQNAGTIMGVVKDTSGAVIPETAITITNTETGLTRTALTGQDGAFRAPALPVGRYTLRIEKIGFRPELQQGLTLEIAQELVLNPVL